MNVWRGVLHVFGLDNGSGPWYLFWSGPFADITIFGAVLGIYWKHVCHVGKCWRWARHPVDGTPYTVCRKHHPSVPASITAEHIVDAHKAAQAK